MIASGRKTFQVSGMEDDPQPVMLRYEAFFGDLAIEQNKIEQEPNDKTISNVVPNLG